MRAIYVSQDEIEAYEAAMQRVVEDERRKREAINDKKKLAIEAAQKVFDEAVKAAEEKTDQELIQSKVDKEQKLAAMQRDFERLPLLRQVYHEAPDDVFELIVFKCSDVIENVWGRGGLNAFRLANKRCKQVVESCATMLTNVQDGPESLPVPIIQRCRRIEEIRCWSNSLRSLEGCADGLEKLYIGNAPHLSDLSPLAFCSRMKSLEILDSSITDISVFSLMPLLEMFVCCKEGGSPSIKDFSPLSSCTRLKTLWLWGNHELKDLSPLTACTVLEDVDIRLCPLITSLAPISTCIALETLQMSSCPLITSLAPLSNLKCLRELWC